MCINYQKMILSYIVVALGALQVSEAAFSFQTDLFIGDLGKIRNGASKDKSCMFRVQKNVDKARNNIAKIHDAKDKLTKIDKGLRNLRIVLGLLKYVPSVGPVLDVLKRSIQLMQPQITKANKAIVKIDRKTWPFKKGLDKVSLKLGKTIEGTQKVINGVDKVKPKVVKARTCVSRMPTSRKNQLSPIFESFSNRANDVTAPFTRIFGTTSRACEAVDKAASAIARLRSDILRNIARSLNKVWRALGPILKFFNKLGDVLRKEFCIKNPAEVTREVAVKAARAAARAAKAAARAAAKAAKAAARFFRRIRIFRRRFWGKKRRRRDASITDLYEDDIFADKRESHALLRSKRGSWCLSAKKILDGINKLFGFLMWPINKLIGLIPKPKFKLPGIPNMSFLNRIRLNLPNPFSIDRWNPNFSAIYNFLNGFNLNCMVKIQGICDSPNGVISVGGSCSRTVGKRGLNEMNTELDDSVDDEEDKIERSLSAIKDLLDTDQSEVDDNEADDNVNDEFQKTFAMLNAEEATQGALDDKADADDTINDKPASKDDIKSTLKAINDLMNTDKSSDDDDDKYLADMLGSTETNLDDQTDMHDDKMDDGKAPTQEEIEKSLKAIKTMVDDMDNEGEK